MVDAVSLKLPTFWAEHPQVWFTQAEAQFHIRKITRMKRNTSMWWLHFINRQLVGSPTFYPRHQRRINTLQYDHGYLARFASVSVTERQSCFT